MIFKKVYLAPNIIHLKFKTKWELTHHLLRFQEHFESPKFRGKTFTVAEFERWYVTQSKCTYYNDWSGFNFPSRIVKTFREGKFNPLSAREKSILNALKKDNGRFYVIATFKESTIKHEVAHALFYVNKEYRKEVVALIENLDMSDFRKAFKKMGYHPLVWLDESHAYLLDDAAYLKRVFKIKASKYKKVRSNLAAIFNRYNPTK